MHDYGKFRSHISAIKDLVDGLESITTTLGLLQQQQASLIEGIDSISDTKSLRLLQAVAPSCSSNASVLQVVSDNASLKVSIIESSLGGMSFHTAPTHQARVPSIPSSASYRPTPYIVEHHVPRVEERDAATQSQVGTLEAVSKIPQHQRWMASLAHRRDDRPRELTFASDDSSYGSHLKSTKEAADAAWLKNFSRLMDEADKGCSLAQRVFVELRSIRRANVSFISVSPVEDRLDRLVASIEGASRHSLRRGCLLDHG